MVQIRPENYSLKVQSYCNHCLKWLNIIILGGVTSLHYAFLLVKKLVTLNSLKTKHLVTCIVLASHCIQILQWPHGRFTCSHPQRSRPLFFVVSDEAALMDAFCLHKPAFDCAYAAGSLCVLMDTIDPNSHGSKTSKNMVVHWWRDRDRWLFLVVKSCQKMSKGQRENPVHCTLKWCILLEKKLVILWQKSLKGNTSTPPKFQPRTPKQRFGRCLSLFQLLIVLVPC